MKSFEKRYQIPAAILLLGCGVLMALQALGLSRGTAGDHWFVLVCLLALMGFALWCVWRETRDWRLVWLVSAPIAAAFFLRTFGLDYASGDYNSFLCHWAEFFRENGGIWAMAYDIGDYNVPYLYFVAAISYLDVPDLYLYKLFSILFDVLLAWGGLRLFRAAGKGRSGGNGASVIVFSILLLLPTVILNGSVWGQCDSIYAALAVHALAQLLEDRPGPSVVLMALAFSFKLQTIFILPLWGVMWLAGRVKFRQLWWFPLAYFVTIFPAILLRKPLGDILGVYLNQMGEYSKLTLLAPSVFQFIPYDAQVNEQLLSTLGVAAAFLLVLALLGLGWRLGRWLDRESFFTMAVVLAIGVPFFLPHMHERYFFLADVLSVCWAWRDKRRFPVCLLVNGASLASYRVYLRLQYNYILTIGSDRYIMALEAVVMLLALILAIWFLVEQLVECRGKMTDRGEEYEAGVLERKRPAGLSEEGLYGVGDGSGCRRDLPSGDEDGAGTGGGGSAGVS